MFIINTPELQNKNIIETYSCGSPNLKDFLENNGVFSIHSYKHIKTKRNIWIFIECDELSALLSEWTKNKPIKKGGEKGG
jgi:hypothetical protein